MRLWFQSTPENLNAQINKLQHEQHILENNGYLNAPGLAFLGKYQPWALPNIGPGLQQFSQISLSFMQFVLGLWHQLVRSVDESSRVYMNAKCSCYKNDNKFHILSFTIKLQHKFYYEISSLHFLGQTFTEQFLNLFYFVK